jgi:hypothetical protein
VEQAPLKTLPHSITPDEFVRMRRWQQQRSRVVMVVAACVAGLIAGGIAGHDKTLLLSAAIFGVLYAYLLVDGPPRWAEKIKRSLEEECTITFSETSVLAESASQSLRDDWTRITRLRTMGDMFVLDTLNLTIFMIPRRAFASDADVERFVELATRRIAETQPPKPKVRTWDLLTQHESSREAD